MRVTFLGTGSAMPTGQRNQSGLLLEAKGNRLLVDCGSGVLVALASTDGGYETLDAVLLTHHHLDHVADLLPLLKARWLADAGPLRVAGPDGTSELLTDLLDVYEYLRDHVDPIIRDLGVGDSTLSGFDIRARSVEHTARALAYRLAPAGADGPALVFSGDTVADPDVLALANGAEALVHDCSFPDGVESDTHPTPTALGRALAEASPDVRTVYLTHFYPHTDGRHDDMLDAIAATYEGAVAVASDGLTITL